MNCAWCGRNADGSDSHGVCDSCMESVFKVKPQEIHKEIEREQEAKQQEQKKGKVTR